MTLSIVPESVQVSNPSGLNDHDPVMWLPPRGPGRSASQVRAALPPVVPGSRSDYPVRINPACIIPGDRIGTWVIRFVQSYELRWHGWPCHCTWGTHNPFPQGCSHDNPQCPCHELYMEYVFLCECDCGTIKTKAGGSLITGHSLSCGHCHHYPACGSVAECEERRGVRHAT